MRSFKCKKYNFINKFGPKKCPQHQIKRDSLKNIYDWQHYAPKEWFDHVEIVETEKLQDLSGLYEIYVEGGTDKGRTLLSCRSNGLVDLWARKNDGVRQSAHWYLKKISNGLYNIKVYGGTNPDKQFLSANKDTNKTDLYSEDDNLGRQQWEFTKING